MSDSITTKELNNFSASFKATLQIPEPAQPAAVTDNYLGINSANINALNSLRSVKPGIHDNPGNPDMSLLWDTLGNFIPTIAISPLSMKPVVKVVDISWSDYQDLLAAGYVKDNVQYNIYGDPDDA